ncbi:MAG TPA: DUF4157 domain-containing protein [Nitrosospira sp.]|nr:DUF4157 domain-containing protein [Nitrosospira sp.]
MSLEDDRDDKTKTLQSKPLATSITPFMQREMVNNEEPEDKEKTAQAKFLAGTSREPLQRQPETEEEETEPIRAKSAGSQTDSFEAENDVETRLSRSKGSGSGLPDPVRAYMEPRFGVDFSHVRVHTGSEAVQMNREVGAKAFTHGSDIYYGAGNNPGNLELTAHELTHVVQQTGGAPVQTKKLDEASSTNTDSSIQRTCAACGAGKEEEKGSGSISAPLQRECANNGSPKLTRAVQQGSAGADALLQRQHVADTGFRYKPPASVTRSIVEIQGIVGTTPDGVYGENTRIAVEKYQTKLKDVGFYSDTLDGKWGNNTDAAHVDFATADTPERKGYNCTGFTFKDYIFRGLASTKSIYSSMTKLADCSKACSPHFHKFWFWEYDLKTVNTTTGASSKTHRDFHTVGGQTDKSGKGPNQVMSKNGRRPVEGPKPPLDWKPVTAPTSDSITGLPVPGFETVRTNHIEECFCNDTLP